jgi:hypothetical protein
MLINSAVLFSTSDSLNIRGKISLLSEISGERPQVVLFSTFDKFYEILISLHGDEREEGLEPLRR